MKYEKGKFFLLLTVLAGSCVMAGAVQAKEGMLLSRGNLAYRDGAEGLEIYTADLRLLKEKLDTVPEEPFSSAYYAHTHQWEYREINEQTHTRHCASCGEAYDLVSVHRAVQEEDVTISWQEKNYDGRCYRCECGQQWVREAAHTLVFDEVDESCHKGRCLLADTAYCRGYESVPEEHYAYYCEPDADGEHHLEICIDCGYQIRKECSFTAGVWEEDDERDPTRCYCECGNSRPKEAEETDTDTDGPSEMPGEEGTAPDEAEETDTDTGGPPETPEEEAPTAGETGEPNAEDVENGGEE